MNTMKAIVLLIIAAVGGITGYAATPLAPGDSGADVNITFPDSLLAQNGGQIINIKNPPDSAMHAAAGDGKTDDTAALLDAYDLIEKNFQAMGPRMRTMYIYIPNGTYLISDTIIYRGDLFKWENHFDICRVKFIGQSRKQTILRMADHSPAFQDKNYIRPMIAFQNADTVFNNIGSGNELCNLTLNVGSGNPGVAAVMFQSANQSDIHNVTIISGDGGGASGICFKIGSVQGYYHDITIEGFDYGIYDTTQPENSVAIENLTLRNQNVAGIYLSGGNLALNNALSDQTRNGVTALKMDDGGAQAVVINSTFTGGSPANSAVELTKEKGQSLFARNLSTHGYASGINRAGAVAVSEASIAEYVTTPATTLSSGQDTHSKALPIQVSPQVPWGNPAKDWAMVDDYPTLQDAMNSGKPVIVFKKASYQMTGDVHVPASVKSINFLGSGVSGGAFLVDVASSNPLLLQESAARVRVLAQRDVIEHCMGGQISNDNGLPVTFYLENVNDCTTGDKFCTPGQKVFARGIDVEYRNVPQITCNGGTLWILGFKTEDSGTAAPFVVKNGGSLEVLGGYVNMCGLVDGPTQSPMITNIESNASITCSTNMTHLFNTAVREIRNGTTLEIPSSTLPNRGGGYRRNFCVPLYVGGTAQ